MLLFQCVKSSVDPDRMTDLNLHCFLDSEYNFLGQIFLKIARFYAQSECLT